MYVESQDWVFPGGAFETSDFGLELVLWLCGFPGLALCLSLNLGLGLGLSLLLTGTRRIPREAIRIVRLRGRHVLVIECASSCGPSFSYCGLRLGIAVGLGTGSIRSPTEAVIRGSENVVVVFATESIPGYMRSERGRRRRRVLPTWRSKGRSIGLWRGSRRGAPRRGA